jgi:hypothetical protein
MKRGWQILIIGIVVIGGCIAYSKRFQITAIVWHWRNGDFARVGNYEVPVPDHWLGKVEPSGLTFLTDTLPKRDSDALSQINVITIDSLPTPTRDLNSWKSYKDQWLKENGINVREERSLSFGNETVICVGGHELHEVLQVPNAANVVSLDCMSSDRLHLTFVGQRPDLEVFYSMIPRIRKQK